MCRAAAAAAASADAPGAAGSVATTRAYRFCTVLIASDIATCTIAKVRSRGLLPTSSATSALVVAFQSVTTSARAAAATIPASKAVARTFDTDFIWILLVEAQRESGQSKSRECVGYAMPVLDARILLCQGKGRLCAIQRPAHYAGWRYDMTAG